MNVLAEKFVTTGLLSFTEGISLTSICSLPRVVAHGTNIMTEGTPAPDVTIILTGVAYRYKTISDGRRQIIGFQLPGDISGLCGHLVPEATMSLAALTTCSIAQIRHADIAELRRSSQAIGRALWLEMLRDIAIYEEWMVNLGQRNARERIAHLICEFIYRTRAGFPEDEPILLKWPLTQTDLADATGLSVVHVYRTLNDLRTQNIIRPKPHALEILNWKRLQDIGGFNARYLQLFRGGSED